MEMVSLEEIFDLRNSIPFKLLPSTKSNTYQPVPYIKSLMSESKPNLIFEISNNSKTDFYDYVIKGNLTSRLERPAVPPELTASPEELLLHAIGVHFSPVVIEWYGVPCYDLGLLRHRGISAAPVVAAAYDLLKKEDRVLQKLIDVSPANISVDGYRIKLVKTLRYIDQNEYAVVDWEEVQKAVPSARSIGFDPDKDTKSPEFSLALAWRQLKHGLMFRNLVKN